MPTYKNVSKMRVTVGNKVVEPGQELHSFSYHDENEVGLLKVKDEPFYNPVILSQMVVDKTTIRIPSKDLTGRFISKFAIHFYVSKGTASINYNSKENKPTLFLYQGAKWNVRCFERQIDSIIISPLMSTQFEVWVQVEKL